MKKQSSENKLVITEEFIFDQNKLSKDPFVFNIKIVLPVLLECKTEKRNSQCEHGQPMEQSRSCFARATQVWLAINHNTSVTSGD